MSSCLTTFTLSSKTDRGLLDTLCKATGDTSGITLIGRYPCNEGNVLTHTIFLISQLPSTLSSYTAAINPHSGPFPNEAWLFHMGCFILCSTCLLLVSPRLFLGMRSWLWLLASMIGTISPIIGLLTHPHAPPSTYWKNGLPWMGIILQVQRIVFRVSGWMDEMQSSHYLNMKRDYCLWCVGRKRCSNSSYLDGTLLYTAKYILGYNGAACSYYPPSSTVVLMDFTNGTLHSCALYPSVDHYTFHPA